MERHTRRPNRLGNYDNSSAGYYFITICARDKRPLLWLPSVGATCGRPPLSPFGRIVEEELLRLGGIYANVRLDKFVIMPNHLHFILKIETGSGGRPQVAPTVSRVVQQFKGAVTKRAGLPLWQKSFHDHVIRGEADYLRIWAYIDTNPLKWREDRYYMSPVEGEIRP